MLAPVGVVVVGAGVGNRGLGACQLLGDRRAALLGPLRLRTLVGTAATRDTRNHHDATAVGAEIKGWSHLPEGTEDATLTSLADRSVVPLRMQDFYAPTDKQRAERKAATVARFIQQPAATSETWTINFLSGYSTTWLGCTPLATTSGYKRNAAALLPLVVSHLEKTPPTARHPLGLVFFDFVGTDSVRGGLWHWRSFDTQGRRLVQLIVEHNF